MDRYMQLVRMKNEVANRNSTEFITDKNMSDWDEEEDILCNIGGSHANAKNIAKSNDDEGSGPNDYNNGNDGGDDDDVGNARSFGYGRGGGRGRGRGGRRDGSGRDLSYNDDNEENAYQRRGGRFNRNNDYGNDENEGTIGNFIEKSEFMKLPRIIPESYDKETVSQFIKDLPKLRKAANVLEMYCIDMYLSKAYDNFLDEALQEENEESNVDSKKPKKPLLPKKPVNNIDNSKEDQRKSELEIQEALCEEFIHNLKALGRNSESELSSERQAQLLEEQSKRNENFWKKKFQDDVGLHRMLLKHFERQEICHERGMQSVLSELHSNDYEITEIDLQRADRRRVGLSKFESRHSRVPETMTSKNENDSCYTPQRATPRPQLPKTNQKSSSSCKSNNDNESHGQGGQSVKKHFQNFSEEFMRLRLPFETFEPPSIPRNSKTASLSRRTLKNFLTYCSDDVELFFRNCRNDAIVKKTLGLQQPQSQDSSFSGGAIRHLEPPLSGSASTSMTPIRIRFGNSTLQQTGGIQSQSGLRDLSTLPDLPPERQTAFDSLRPETSGGVPIVQESAADSDGILPPNFEPIDISFSPLDTHGIVDLQNLRAETPITTHGKGDPLNQNRLTDIIEQRETMFEARRITENEIIFQPTTALECIQNNAESSVINENNAESSVINENNVIPISTEFFNPPEPELENIDILAKENTPPRDWFDILRSQKLNIDYVAPNPNQQENRRRRRRRRRQSRPILHSGQHLNDSIQIQPENLTANPLDNLHISQLPPMPAIPEAPIFIPNEDNNIFQIPIDSLQRAQSNHEQFLLDNVESLSVIMDNAEIFEKMMLEYMEICNRDESFYPEGGDGNFEGRNNRGGRGGRGGGRGGRGRGAGRFNGDRDNGEEGGEPQKPREFYIPPDPTQDENEMFNSGIMSGLNFSKYDNIPVKVSGLNIPESIDAFDDVGFRGLVNDNILKSGYKIPTPIQKTAIPVIMASRDLMACAQTGSGKTAAFLLPIINSLLSESAEMAIGRPLALILAPTRELAIQIFNEARKFSHGSYLKTSIVYGGTSSKHQSETVAKGCHILIATPGRLLDFVDRQFITFEDIRFVVLDEADRMLDMGFKESIDKIMSHITMRDRAERQNLMFSATFPEDIQLLASNYLRDYIFVTIGIIGGACADVKQTIFEVPKFEKRGKLMEMLNEGADGTIVFVETKRGADFLASLLSETDIPTTSIHGDRLQRQREEALRDFKTGRMKVLVATSVAARGLDIRNVKHVVNYDMPDSLDEYVHRIGRTGRLGNNGRSTSFFDPENDADLASGLIKILEGSGQEVPNFLHNHAMGGGGLEYKSNNFGARDMRRNRNFVEKPAPLEAEEEWD